MQTSGLVNRALPGTAPGALRPAFKHGYRGNLVCGVRIFVDIKFAGRGGDDRKRLDGYVSFGKARHVNVASAAAAEQVASPEQAVSMEISDGELAMKRFCLSGDLVRRSVQRVIEVALDDAGQQEPGDDKNDDHKQEPAQAFHALKHIILLDFRPGLC